MKKDNVQRTDVSRKTRVISNLLGIVLLLILLLVFSQSPALTAKGQFRRVEKANFVGPATILDTVSLDYDSYDSLLLATGEQGVSIFRYDKDDLKRNDFTYREKMGNTTVLAIPNQSWLSFETRFSANVPIVVFDSYPEAVRSELSITLTDGEAFQQEYHLTATRNGSGYFLFMLSANSAKPLGKEGLAMALLTQISDDTPRTANGEIAVPATVRYYDTADTLICEDTVIIRSPAGCLHEPVENESKHIIWQ